MFGSNFWLTQNNLSATVYVCARLGRWPVRAGLRHRQQGVVPGGDPAAGADPGLQEAVPQGGRAQPAARADGDRGQQVRPRVPPRHRPQRRGGAVGRPSQLHMRGDVGQEEYQCGRGVQAAVQHGAPAGGDEPFPAP